MDDQLCRERRISLRPPGPPRAKNSKQLGPRGHESPRTEQQQIRQILPGPPLPQPNNNKNGELQTPDQPRRLQEAKLHNPRIPTKRSKTGPGARNKEHSSKHWGEREQHVEMDGGVQGMRGGSTHLPHARKKIRGGAEQGEGGDGVHPGAEEGDPGEGLHGEFHGGGL